MILRETLFQDLRYGVHWLRRDPCTTAVTVLALALRIAVNAAVFTGVKGMVTHPPDPHAPERW